MFYNFPLIAALVANVLAQVIKVFFYYIFQRKLDWSLMVGTGGFPSSHSATVTAVTTSVAFTEGSGSPLFAACVVFSLITMYDATGVRRQAGEQAAVLNKLMKEFQHVFDDREDKGKKLKELLGHKPVEVVAGALFGIIVAVLLRLILPV